MDFRRKVGDFDGFEEEMRWFLVVFLVRIRCFGVILRWELGDFW